jgi:serine/threonine protein kinase
MKFWRLEVAEGERVADHHSVSKATLTGQSGRVVTKKGRHAGASPGTGSDSIRTRVVRENGPARAIDGLERTMVLSTDGNLAEHEGDDTGYRDIRAPGGTVSDLMEQSPQPLGADISDSDPMINVRPVLEELTGKKLGRYEILGVLGQGAMGTVYKGQDPAIDRMVALKTILAGVGHDAAQAEQLRERLVREAKAAGKLSHPNIVTVYDVGAEGDLNYIAMDYLEGYTLEQLIKKNVQLNYHIAAKIIMQVCAALEYAHKAGIVHRDIKPANIMVLDNFEIKVTDFGIARFDSPHMSMTQTGIAMGTPHYISPEQLRGENVDRRCDIFSLGVVAYELLTRKRPFAGNNISALIYSITQTDPAPPSTVDENIPGLFDMVVGRALAKDPLERYQSADQMAQDLKAFAQEMTSPSYRI